MSKQDRQGVRTAADLERKYDFSNMAGGKSTEQLGNLNRLLSQYMADTNATIASIEEQIANIEAGRLNVGVVYPVGAIYASVADTDPSELFGGTWERFAKGQALVGCDEETVAEEEKIMFFIPTSFITLVSTKVEFRLLS